MTFGLREAIFLIVLLAVPTVSLFYVFKPRNEDIREALHEITVKQTRLDKLEEVTAKIDDIGLAIEEGRDSIAMIEAKLPSDQDVEGIMEQVWQIAARNRLTVKSVKSEKMAPAAQYRELPLKMIVEGEFDGFYQFLLELENLERITRIHEMSLDRASAHAAGRRADLAPGAMTAEFTLSIYFEPDAEESQ
ncbi:MAG: type 4a pilus biogenesis protein PilO [Phycisphaerales bacterium]|nr:type 4a pilus biogenesis protein PilO [Phycisphaerae bacterium]NNF43821.1 type 4a pilus biogenesis protein PilO [Phycisphaerales bacterium]NNM27193.1 type 4a pilus biogenesis protein PilO [Phycisphaerales bacterium]